MNKLLDIPAGSGATVKIIDLAWLSNIPLEPYMEPSPPGFTHFSCPTYVFLIENGEGRRILFDLGLRKDWQNLPPAAIEEIEHDGIGIAVEEDVTEVLEKNGIKLDSIEALIPSHHHWDHMGTPKLFPSNTKLVVGPGFKKAYMPGCPVNKDSPILASDHEGREVDEISFDGKNGVTIGHFSAVDYFGDGSVFLLDAPGHTLGHICALVRTTTSPDTSVLLGGDACHHNGEFRPSEYRLLPDEIIPHPARAGDMSICSGSCFKSYLHTIGRSTQEPFFRMPTDQKFAMYTYDAVAAEETIVKVQRTDGFDNVFIIIAHDESIRGTVDMFPKDINAWKDKGWADGTRWVFLKNFSGLLNDVVSS